MTIEGHIQNGHVVLDVPMDVPDGTKVVVFVRQESDASDPEEGYGSLYERLKRVAGKAEGLPSDLALNHDHYLHGQPKRE